jgi:S-layer homology domain
MNQKKYQVNCKNILLLGTFLSTTIISSNTAFAANLPEVTNQAIDSTLSLDAALQQASISSSADLLAANTIDPSLPAVTAGQQLAQASDVAGNWAEPFIQVLVEKGIIAGYPDGTFRPDQPVTRAEFAALLNKAFDLTPTKPSTTFSDVPSKFWGAAVIDKAYRAGFLAGYPNKTFGPTQNIVRIESLVSITNGSKLQADAAAPKVDDLFSDSAQVPGFGRDALIAATQKCLAVSVSYPEGKTFNPNGVATRADVAAFIHQALVGSGKLTALAADNPAQKYIANCAPAPSLAKITEQDVLNRAGVGTLPGIETAAVRKPLNAPVSGITTPSGFGANWGDVFIGAGYQDSFKPITAGNNTTGFGLTGGFGIGDSRNLIGLETSYSTNDSGASAGTSTGLGANTGTALFDRGGVNFKLHKQFGDNVSVAAGWENAIRDDRDTTRETFYGVLTGILPVGDTNNFTASVGIGNGRFRPISNIIANANNDTTSVFGSLGFRVSENIGLVADYNGRNFSVGLPLTLQLSDNVGLQVTPAILDVAGDRVNGEQSRFGVGGGLGIRF